MRFSVLPLTFCHSFPVQRVASLMDARAIEVLPVSSNFDGKSTFCALFWIASSMIVQAKSDSGTMTARSFFTRPRGMS